MGFYYVWLNQSVGDGNLFLDRSPLDGVHKVRVAVGNGLRADIWDQFKTRFGIPNICKFFGATEYTVAIMNINNRMGACGRYSPLINMIDPTPTILIKYDTDTSEAIRDKNGRCIQVNVGESGLLLGGVPITYGDLQFYKGGREISEKKLLRNVLVEVDCYFNFGDILTMDKDYFVYFKDRIGDTFRWKGENVATYEVSNELSKLDFIHDANVYGVEKPDVPISGQITNAIALLAKLGVACGWQAMIIFTTEMYPTVVRTIAYGVHSTAARVGGMVAPQIVSLDDDVPGVLYFMSGVLMVISAGLVLVFKETRSKVLEDTFVDNKSKDNINGDTRVESVTKF